MVLSFFLFGYRPRLNNLVDVWTDNWSHIVESELRRYPYNWRRWSDIGEDGDYPEMPVWAVPIFLVFEIAICLAIFNSFYVLFLHVSFVLFLIIIVLIPIIIIAFKKINSYLKKESTKREMEEAAQIAALAKDEKYLDYLKANVTFGLTPYRVNVGDILKKVDTTTRFKISFWATKAKVCRPFSK